MELDICVMTRNYIKVRDTFIMAVFTGTVNYDNSSITKLAYLRHKCNTLPSTERFNFFSIALFEKHLEKCFDK